MSKSNSTPTTTTNTADTSTDALHTSSSDIEISLSQRLKNLSTEDDELNANLNDHTLDSDDDAANQNNNINTHATHAIKSAKEIQLEQEAELLEQSMTSDQKQIKLLIHEFRSRIEPHVIQWQDKSELVRESSLDRVLIKFLTARKYDMNKSIDMWLSTVQWRYDMNIDSILDEPYRDGTRINQTLNNQCDHKYDKFGRSVYYECVGKLEPNKIFNLLTMDDMLAYQRHNTEYRRKYVMSIGSIRMNRSIDQITSIVDLHGVGVKHMKSTIYKFLKQLAQINQSYYPEFLGRLLIINAPSAFSVAWKMIRPWLADRVRAKISIHNNIPYNELLSLIDKENLPKEYGGMCTCPGGCLTNGSLLHKYYIGICQYGISGMSVKNELFNDIVKLNQLMNIPEIYDNLLNDLHEKYKPFMQQHFPVIATQK